jgi:HK97 family phage major capsid protein
VEEVIAASKRTTSPTTVYKKQKLDRDDILDITDFDVVVWLQSEMRLMLDEEIARAILVGDGRLVTDPDKILDPAGANSGDGIRSILSDSATYAHPVVIDNTVANWTTNDLIDQVTMAMPYYKGSGTPTLYTTIHIINDIMLKRDTLGRRIYGSVSDIASEMGVSAIIPCEALEATANLVGILVNLTDYTIGTDKGGQINFFDFFDIDYNQYKYLLETRCSGALTKLRSAIVFTSTAAVVPAGASRDSEG